MQVARRRRKTASKASYIRVHTSECRGRRSKKRGSRNIETLSGHLEARLGW